MIRHFPTVLADSAARISSRRAGIARAAAPRFTLVGTDRRKKNTPVAKGTVPAC
jgi:hypothetical protein